MSKYKQVSRGHIKLQFFSVLVERQSNILGMAYLSPASYC